MASGALTSALLQGLGSTQPLEGALAEELRAALEAAHAAFPEVAIPLPTLAYELGERLRRANRPVVAVRDLEAADLLIAVGALHDDRGALTALDARLRRWVPRSVARLRLSPDQLDEALQRVREKLLLPREDGARGLAEYTGLWPLAGFVKALAVWTATDLMRRRQVLSEEDPEDALARLAQEGDPAFEALRSRHQPQLKAAFQAAVGALDARARGVLKMNVLDGLSIDRIAEFHGVHRSSAARWLQEIRQRLLEDTRARLADALSLEDVELDTLIRNLRGHLEVSLPRLLDAPEGSR